MLELTQVSEIIRGKAPQVAFNSTWVPVATLLLQSVEFLGRAYFVVKTMLEAATKRKRQKAEKELHQTVLPPKGI